MNSRREFLIKSTIAGIGVSLLGRSALDAKAKPEPFIDFQQSSGPYTLPALPYEYDALEPHIDMQTMQLHHDKHHQAYVTNLNKALETIKNAPSALEDLLKNVSKYPAAVR